MSKFREIILPSGTKLLLGKNENNNDELMEEFKGKPNIILHTIAPGSPFCVIENELNPTRIDLQLSGSVCLGYSQIWRDKKTDAKVNIFTGKDITKPENAKPGTWRVKNAKTKLITKKEVLNSKKLLK